MSLLKVLQSRIRGNNVRSKLRNEFMNKPMFGNHTTYKQATNNRIVKYEK